VVARFGRAFANLRDLADTLHVLDAFGMHLHVIDVALTPLTAEGRAVGAACRRLAEAERVLAKEIGTDQFRRRRLAGMPLNGSPLPCHKYSGPREKRRLVQDARATDRRAGRLLAAGRLGLGEGLLRVTACWCTQAEPQGVQPDGPAAHGRGRGSPSGARGGGQRASLRRGTGAARPVARLNELESPAPAWGGGRAKQHTQGIL
jgi:hypothetical protein